MTQEIRLPKCLTQEEQEAMREYIDGVIYDAKHTRDEPAPNYPIKGIFLLYKEDVPNTRRFDPVGEFYPWRFNLDIEGSLNYALRETLEDVLTDSFSKPWGEGDIVCFFCRAYAMAIHSLNNYRPERDYDIFSELWQDESLIERKKLGGLIKMSLTDYDKTQCELICACMVYCILERENEPNVKRLLQQIQRWLKKSRSGINQETLERFQQAVAESIEAKTETPTNEQNTAEPTPPTNQKDAASITTQEEEKIKNAKKRAPKSLFLKQEDEALWKERVTTFFATEMSSPLDSSNKNVALRCMAWFLYIWEQKGIIISQPYMATVRFMLKCGFTLDGAEARTISNVISRLVKQRNEDTDSKERVMALCKTGSHNA